MSGYLFDTDRTADYLNDRPEAVEVIEYLIPLGATISIITYAEIYRRIYFGRDRQAAEQKFFAMLRSIPVIPIVERVARRWAILKGTVRVPQGRNIDLDLFIAATALEYDMEIVTRNMRDYQIIPGLKLYHTS